MGFFDDMFGGKRRRARAHEGRGQHREAATLYLEAGDRLAAAGALGHAADQLRDVESKLAAYRDALRALDGLVDDASAETLRDDLGVRFGRAVLAELAGAQSLGGTERRWLDEAARKLEAAKQFSDAASAWERLGDHDAATRCLELGGEVDRLEALLSQHNRRVAAGDAKSGALRDYEGSMALGDRAGARDAIARARRADPDDRTLREHEEALRARWLGDQRVTLKTTSEAIVVVGRGAVVIGRTEGDVLLRGASVSRRHASFTIDGDRVVVADVGSRNGTRVRGVSIAQQFIATEPTEVDLGDDVGVRVGVELGQLIIEVVRGLDRGLRIVGAAGRVTLAREQLVVRFEGDRTVLESEGPVLELDGVRVATEIDLLAGDRIRHGDRLFEVVR